MSSSNIVKVSPSHLTNLQNKTVLITGGSSGIGLATAELISSLSPSNNIIIVDRATPPSDIKIPPSKLFFQQCDITSWVQQRSAFVAGEKRFGRIDVVFVNAGILDHGDQFFKDEFDADGQLRELDKRCLDIDLTAACDTVKLAIHHLRKNGKDGGSIVMTASLTSYIPTPDAPMYSAAKHGILGLMGAMKRNLAKLNIAISVVAPGITKTPLLRGALGLDSIEEWVRAMKRLGVAINTPDTVSLAAAYLINAGMKASGVALLIQENQIVEVESGIARTRNLRMGVEMLQLFKRGREAPLSSRI